MCAVLLAGSALLLQPQAFGQGPKPQTAPAKKTTEAAPSAPSSTHELTAADVEAFLDGLMPLQLQREDIAGAVVVVVKDGKILFGKGYGYSDVEKKIPVTADATLFRPGSVSKLFTWTAVMQQVEQGKLDLDRDVNDYLDFKIPPRDGKPITLRNIMTHTPGFEETIQQLFISDSKDLVPLGDYLKAHLPNRVYAPGTLPAYSNYATTIAGYIVQRTSGQSFDDYIEQHILTPLGMSHTTFRQPLPAGLVPLMSKGYQRGSLPAKPYEVVQAAPAGSSATTGDDMARFVIAHLQNGQYEGAQILRPETAQLMHSAQFHNLPQLNGMALGFYEETRNGHRIIGHAGDTEYFHSDLHLIPDANVGIFMSYNSAGKGEISPRNAMWEKFLDRYFPYQPTDTPAIASAKKDASEVAGRYLNTRRGDTTLFRMFASVGQAKVAVNTDDTISIDALKDLNGQPKKFREIGPMLFQEVGGQDLLGFKQDSGRLVMAAGEFPFMVFQKARWYENSALNTFVIVGALVVFALTLLLWPIGALIRRHYGRKLEMELGERRRRLLVRVVCLLDLAFVLGLVLFFSIAIKDIALLSPKFNGWLRLIQLLGWLGVVGTLIAIYNAFRSWSNGQRWFWSKLGDTAIAVACLGFVWFVFAWNMLTLSLRY
jgi:CubicO group peptidase (beta-lactamase class C family)